MNQDLLEALGSEAAAVIPAPEEEKLPADAQVGGVPGAPTRPKVGPT